MKKETKDDLIDSAIIAVGIPAYVIGLDTVSAAKEAGGMKFDILKEAVSKANPKTLVTAGCAAGAAFYLGKLVTRKIDQSL